MVTASWGLMVRFGEHIRLALQLAILVQHLQGTEQVVAAVIGKGQPVRPVIDKAVLGGKIVIEPVQLGHLSPGCRHPARRRPSPGR